MFTMTRNKITMCADEEGEGREGEDQTPGGRWRDLVERVVPGIGRKPWGERHLIISQLPGKGTYLEMHWGPSEFTPGAGLNRGESQAE